MIAVGVQPPLVELEELELLEEELLELDEEELEELLVVVEPLEPTQPGAIKLPS